MKKTALLMALVLSVFALLVGCGGGGGDTSSSAGARITEVYVEEMTQTYGWVVAKVDAAGMDVNVKEETMPGPHVDGEKEENFTLLPIGEDNTVRVWTGILVPGKVYHTDFSLVLAKNGIPIDSKTISGTAVYIEYQTVP